MVVTDIVINPNEPDLEMTNIGDSRKSRKGNSNSRNKQLGSVNILNTLSSFDTEENSKSDSKSSGRNTRNLLKRNKGNSSFINVYSQLGRTFRGDFISIQDYSLLAR